MRPIVTDDTEVGTIATGVFRILPSYVLCRISPWTNAAISYLVGVDSLTWRTRLSDITLKHLSSPVLQYVSLIPAHAQVIRTNTNTTNNNHCC